MRRPVNLSLVAASRESAGFRSRVGCAALSRDAATRERFRGPLREVLLRRILALLVVSLLFHPSVAQAYLGPGAGFTIVSTFFVLFTALASALVVLLTWPFRWVLKRVFRPKRAGIATARRVVIVGLD